MFTVCFIIDIELLPYFAECFKKHGPVVHLNLAGKSYVLLNDPEDIKVSLTTMKRYVNVGRIASWNNCKISVFFFGIASYFLFYQ